MRNGLNRNHPRRRPRSGHLPASSFYFLVAGFAAATFFVVIAVFHDEKGEPEIIVGGLVASSVLIAGVVLRELVLRNAQEKLAAERKQLDSNLKTVFSHFPEVRNRKLTLEKNDAAIRLIRTKSEAAKVFEKVAQGHREVFELCTEYRKIVADEIRDIHPDSPRLKALIHGNEFALKTHKFHILRWAELESKSLAVAAQRSGDDIARTEFMERAKRPLEIALSHYPEEAALKDSLGVITELLFTLRIRRFVTDAEAAASIGDRDTAVMNYREALRQMEFEDPAGEHSEIRAQIEDALAAIDKA